ncbi:MAG: hypothetical protein LUD72_01430 [Bacteroidales bacterium]|nr:hypothetical protein [Bacteroidales bacterium]
MSKVCPKCGSQVNDDEDVCQVCGTPVNAEEPPQEENPVQDGEPEQEVSQAQEESPAQEENPPKRESRASQGGGNNGEAKTVVSHMCGSAGLLIFAILLSVSEILTIIRYCSEGTFTTTQIVEVVLCIPMILICIGCWMLWGGNAGNRMSGSGFKFISGSLLATMIVDIVAVVFMAVMVLAGGVLLSDMLKEAFSFLEASDLETITHLEVGGIIAVIVIAVIALLVLIFFFNGLRKPCKSGHAIMEGTETQWHGPVFAIIVLIVIAVFQIAVVVFAIMDMAQGEKTGAMEMIMHCLHAAVLVYAVIYLFMIRSKNKNYLK